VKRLLVGFAVTSALVLLLSACSNTPTRPSATRAPAATSTTAPTTTTSSILVGPPSTTSTSVPLAGAGNQCTPGDLRASWPGFGNGASEHLFYVVNLENVSDRACVTGGYVGVAAYDPEGRLIEASEERAPSLGPDEALSVDPGTSMHFTIGLPDVDIETGTECSTVVGALHLIPPDERTDLQVATPITAGFPKLCGDSFLIGPLVSGAITN
jgi:hypothetical protein